MINALCIANTILNKAFNENIALNPMKLQKLIYFLYKDYLKTTGKSLFNENFQAWQNGPVLKSVHEQFKLYGSNEIKDYYCTFKNGQKIYTIIDEKSCEEFSNSLAIIWNNCKNLSIYELSYFIEDYESAWNKAKLDETYILKDENIINERDYI